MFAMIFNQFQKELFLSGHENGYIGIHYLDTQSTEDGTITKPGKQETVVIPSAVGQGKRPQSRDHQGPINSIDSDRSLEIFCTSSSDGFLRLWDKTKALLREISLDCSLTSARFLNNRGDILIGFKQHIFLISHTKVLPSKELQYRSDDGEAESFETESDIYEDPSVRYESKKILQPDPTNMENYLVPFPNLELKTSFFMEGRPPPDLQHQDLQEDLESLSSLSDNLSLAPTDIYYSPYSTPRSMSLSSGPVVVRRNTKSDGIKFTNTDTWKLPHFGDSPVSSPPRTPPPEPTPPPTPTPEESTEDEDQDNNEHHEPTSKDTPLCEECKTPVKAKEKKAVTFPSFKRGGRLSNIRIDSKSLRGSSGPGYAAPVVRQNVQIPEPNPYKPRRPPKITKKVKKTKEKTEESQKQQDENPTNSNYQNNPLNAGNDTTVKGSEIERLPFGSDGGQSLLSNPISASRRDESSKQGPLDSTGGSDLQYSRSGKYNDSGGKELQQKENGKLKNMAHDNKDGGTEDGQLQGPDESGSQQETKPTGQNAMQLDEGTNETEEGEKQILSNSNDNDNGMADFKVVNPSEDYRFIHSNVHDGLDDFDAEIVRVVYFDPDTGQSVEGALAEVPEGAKIIEIIDSSQDKDSIASAAVLSKQDKRQKSVTFSKQEREDNKSNKSKQKGHHLDFGGDSLRPQRGRGYNDRTYVVPFEDRNPDLQEDLVIKGFLKNTNVSPLTIFALARSRKANAAKQTRSAKTAHSSSSDYPMYLPDKNNVKGNITTTESFNHKANLTAEEDVPRPSFQLSAIERPKSSRKPKDDVVKWCINALRKSNTQLYIPEKPSRPGSSENSRKDEAMWVNKLAGTKKGQTLFINVPEKLPRPKSTATSHSTGSEEFSLHPYKGLLGADDGTGKPPQIHNTRARTAPPGRRRTNIPEMTMDAQGNMHDSLESARNNDGYYNDFCRFQTTDERPVSSLDFPTLYVEDYSGNWQEIVLARARLLKQQRLERQKSAKERRTTQNNERKERWKKSNHSDCAKGEDDKPEASVEFVPTFESNPHQTSTTLQGNTLKQLKEQELSSEQPFRLRIHPRHGSSSLTGPARSLITVMSNEHNVEDIARVMPRPKTAASIPNKCSRFILVSGDPKPNPESPKPTKMEQTLMMTRFPKDLGLKNNREKKQRTRMRETLEIK